MSQHFLLSRPAKTLSLAQGLPHVGRGSPGDVLQSAPVVSGQRIVVAWMPMSAAVQTVPSGSVAGLAKRISR
jgi:hypothetical protein